MIEFDPAKGDARVDCTTLYKGLGQFNNVASVHVTWEWHQDDHLRSDSFGFKIPHLWRKAWVGQLSACKAMQWAINDVNCVIGQPRKDSKTTFDFAPYFVGL